jgi:hypothetical protein
MELPGDVPPDAEPEVTETEETRETVEPARLDGQTIAVCVGAFCMGAALVGIAFGLTSDEALKIIAVVGGIALMLAAFAGAISRGFRVEASRDHFRADAEIPRGHVKTTKKTKVTKLAVSKSLVEGRAPPKQGTLPAASGEMPPTKQAGLLLSEGGADGDAPSSASSAARGRDSARGQPEETPPDHPSSATP